MQAEQYHSSWVRFHWPDGHHNDLQQQSFTTSKLYPLYHSRTVSEANDMQAINHAHQEQEVDDMWEGRIANKVQPFSFPPTLCVGGTMKVTYWPVSSFRQGHVLSMIPWELHFMHCLGL